MAIEDTFGYRFVRISLVLFNCLVLVRLISLLLQFSHIYDPMFVLLILFIGSNFMVAIIGAIREHRIAVLITGSLTLIMFLSLLFTNKENKNINISLFTLLAIAAQSLIFSEMLKERQIFGQRQNLEIFNNTASRSNVGHPPLAAVVVYQPPGSRINQGQSGGIFTMDPVLGTEMLKDPPPSYFASSCPPPKYEDAVQLNASTILPTLSTETTSEQNNNNENIDQTSASSLPNSTIAVDSSSHTEATRSDARDGNNNENDQNHNSN